MVATAVTADGSKIKWASPTLKRNTYLEHMNYDAWVGYAGGCDLGSGVSTFQQRMWIRGPRRVALAPARTCAEVKAQAPASADGVYTLTRTDGSTEEVFCDMTTDGGGWTYVNEAGRAIDTMFDVFEESTGGYHQFVYDLRGLVFDEVMAVRTGAHWCNSWGSGQGNFIDKASMGVAVDREWFHYYNGQYSPYRLIKQDYGIRSPGGWVTCSSCWANTGMVFTSDMAATDVSADGDGKKIKWTPATQRNSHLEMMNYDAFISQAGGCNALTGTSGQSVFVRERVLQGLSTAANCGDILEANPAAPDGCVPLYLCFDLAGLCGWCGVLFLSSFSFPFHCLASFFFFFCFVFVFVFFLLFTASFSPSFLAPSSCVVCSSCSACVLG